MAEFEVPVVRIDSIEPIPGADMIELAVVGGYRSVVKKGAFNPNDLAVYIPEGALIPDELLERIGLTGKLAGSGHNRVKAVKLRGCLSQGITIRLNELYEHGENYPAEGDNVAEYLGIIKYEPKLPSNLTGTARPLGALYGTTRKYDVENVKKFNHEFLDGETVIVTEKIHGTNVQVGYIKKDDLVYVTSKGLGARGIVLEPEDGNLYNRVAAEHNLLEVVKHWGEGELVEQLALFGEIYGMGVQDLSYNTSPTFAAFDLWVRWTDGEEGYIDAELLEMILGAASVPYVPVLYEGPYHEGLLAELSEGKREQVSSKEVHMMEGVVCVPAVERVDSHGNRLKLKHVTEQYLLRKGEVTEFN